MIKDNTDIHIVSETKLDSSFTNAQFLLEGYTPPFTYDRNCHGGENSFIYKERYTPRYVKHNINKQF